MNWLSYQFRFTTPGWSTSSPRVERSIDHPLQDQPIKDQRPLFITQLKIILSKTKHQRSSIIDHLTSPRVHPRRFSARTGACCRTLFRPGSRTRSPSCLQHIQNFYPVPFTIKSKRIIASTLTISAKLGSVRFISYFHFLNLFFLHQKEVVSL